MLLCGVSAVKQSQRFSVKYSIDTKVFTERMSYLNSPFYPDTLNEDFDSYDEEFEENESEDDVNNNSGSILINRNVPQWIFNSLLKIPDTEEASESEFNSGSHHRNNAEPVEIKEQ